MLVFFHIADGVQHNQRTDNRDDEHENRGERINDKKRGFDDFSDWVEFFVEDEAELQHREQRHDEMLEAQADADKERGDKDFKRGGDCDALRKQMIFMPAGDG